MAGEALEEMDRVVASGVANSSTLEPRCLLQMNRQK